TKAKVNGFIHKAHEGIENMNRKESFFLFKVNQEENKEQTTPKVEVRVIDKTQHGIYDVHFYKAEYSQEENKKFKVFHVWKLLFLIKTRPL
ncbi:MAG: hypothetical protein ACPHSE_07860, partial [Flavobacteriaceae bacterium]